MRPPARLAAHVLDALGAGERNEELEQLDGPVEPGLHRLEGLVRAEGDAVLTAVPEGRDRTELGVQLVEEVVEVAGLLQVRKVAQSRRKYMLYIFA